MPWIGAAIFFAVLVANALRWMLKSEVAGPVARDEITGESRVAVLKALRVTSEEAMLLIYVLFCSYRARKL